MALSKVVCQNTKRYSKIIDVCDTYKSEVIYDSPFKSFVMYDLPFKIRIQNITIPGYGPSNIPPIGIAIIGFNNYIL